MDDFSILLWFAQFMLAAKVGEPLPQVVVTKSHMDSD
jgi:hypothetical protein